MNKKELLADFAHKKYGFFEDASVQVCEWNKKSLRGQGNCYKQDFYGADTISCHQIAPTTFWCNNSCVFCWRPKEYMKGTPEKSADPAKMIEALIEERRDLISGFGGHDKVSKETYSRAREAKHWAISLSGEPTLYKKLPELISLLKKRKGTETVFLVSNGQNPKMLQKLWSESKRNSKGSKKSKNENENSLPTQLYISMVAPEERLWKGITLNREKGGWKKYLRSLALLKLLPCRTVIRLTVIKGMNDSKETLNKFVELLEAVGTDFIEVKSYMWLGLSRKRLTAENNPSHEYTKDFALSLLKRMPSYKFEAEKANSRIVLLKNKGSKFKTKIIDRN